MIFAVNVENIHLLKGLIRNSVLVNVIMSEDEVADVRPVFKNVSTKCFTCHKELVIRRPTHEEQIRMLQFLREKWDLNVSKPEDIYLMGEPCSCGQPVQAYFEVNADRLK